MHLLAAEPGTIQDGTAAVDLGQTPAEIVVLRAADTEIACLAAAQASLLAENAARPRLRLANLLRLKHNYSVDLYAEQVVARAPGGGAVAGRAQLLALRYRPSG